MKVLVASILLLALGLPAQAAPLPGSHGNSGHKGPGAPAPSSPEPWAPLAFLEGSWEANGRGPGGVVSSGSYTFEPELARHILARHASAADCKGPSTFDCEHGDLLYVYQEGPAGNLKAIYFDSEGHVIHYDVSTPDPGTAIFLSSASQPGPQFRLTYQLRGGIMTGSFQMHMPGQSEWMTYLDWRGAKK